MADFVANVFLEVMRSAGGYDRRRGNAVAWLYGLAGNVALLDTDDYARVEERIDGGRGRRNRRRLNPSQARSAG